MTFELWYHRCVAGARDSTSNTDTTGGTGRGLRWAFPTGVGAATLGVFLMTLAPTVTAEDSGELIAAAWHFGIPHPPGYPLWTLLCGLFLHGVPLGSVAFKANLFSALCSSAAAVVAYTALRQIHLVRPAAAAAALVWIWSRWSWSQSVITEVYALNSLLTAVLLLSVLRWHRTSRTRPLVVASLVLGLGMSNHHIIALAGLALAAWVLARSPGLMRNWRLIVRCTLAFVLGLLPYAYLPIRAAADPPMNWGDPSTFGRFRDHVARSQYGTVGPIKTAEQRAPGRLWRQLSYLGESICDDLTPWLLGVAVLGALLLMRNHRDLLFLVFLWLSGTGLIFALLANFDLDTTARWAMRVFLIPVSLGLVIPIGFALQQCLKIVTRCAAGRRRIASLAAGAVVLLLPALQLRAHWHRCDYSNYWYAHEHAENILGCMQKGAMLFPSGDHNTFPLVYLQLVEQRRPDVLIADIYGYVNPALYGDRPTDSHDSPEAWLIKRARRPVYYTTKKNPPVDNATIVPAGMLYHLLPDGMNFDDRGLLEQCTYRNLDAPTVIDHGTRHILSDYEFFAGLGALGSGETSTALEHMARAADYGTGVKEVFNNIGSALGEHAHHGQAQEYFRHAADLDARYVLPRWNLVRLSKGQERRDRARQALDEIIRAEPDDYRAYGELGFMLDLHFNDRAGAVRAWRASLQRNPDQPQIIQALERTEEQSGGRNDR